MKILLVEDTLTLRLMGKMMLEKVGAEVMIVEDGEVQSRLLCFGVFQS